jgi:hypothetical protein
LITVPRSTTTTISVQEYAFADVAVDQHAHALGLTLSPDVRQCALVSWIQHGSRAEREGMLVYSPTAIGETESRRHVAAAFAQCLSATNLHTAILALWAASHLGNGECIAGRLEAARLPAEAVWLGLYIGFDAAGPAASAAFEAARRWCGV